jgi:peptidoglycan hydrolase-like protein with peptidoglycan-binding domain
MTRKLAIVAGVLFAAVSAGTLTAQSTATPKPTSTSGTMQHSRPTVSRAGQQDSTSARASSGTKVHARWTKDQVTQAQQGLAKAGYYKGTPSGKYDRATRKAIREYQKANKLQVTGRLDKNLLAKLQSS